MDGDPVSKFKENPDKRAPENPIENMDMLIIANLVTKAKLIYDEVNDNNDTMKKLFDNCLE